MRVFGVADRRIQAAADYFHSLLCVISLVHPSAATGRRPVFPPTSDKQTVRHSQATATAREPATQEIHPLFHRQSEPAGNEVLELKLALGREDCACCATGISRDSRGPSPASRLLR
jgi:hypothetical protein